MYRAWAKNRHMQLSEIAGDARRGLPRLLVSGFGADRTLRQEVGLHVFEFAETEKGTSRATALVRIAVAPLADLPPEKLRMAIGRLLDEGAAPTTVVRRYRHEPSPLVRNMIGSWRSGRLDAVLGGDFDLIGASQSQVR
jgi:ATP-dependent Clp protease ATP-binding subunit ClpC